MPHLRVARRVEAEDSPPHSGPLKLSRRAERHAATSRQLNIRQLFHVLSLAWNEKIDDSLASLEAMPMKTSSNETITRL